MNASKPAFRFRGVVASLAAAVLLTACSNDYRGDANALPRNEPLTAALRGRASSRTYTLPEEIRSLNCFFARNGMNCDVVLDVRDPDVAKELRNPARRIIDLDDKTWHRRDGTEQLISNESEYLALSEAKFNFVVEHDARAGGWVVRANVDQSRVPFEEAAALMLLAVVDTASEYKATLKKLYANSPRANAESWGNVAPGLGGTEARSTSDTTAHAAVDSPPAIASSVGAPNSEPGAAAASNRPGAAK
ncbi:hypothetical protein KEH56_18600 (plasmid) [Burkholderia cenocepacia]|uniref:hypothetical protein n=1 Tax=Burkholderia cepacia complex TaxID=87882 RepID=UPI001BA7926D|nr:MULTISPECIES: hypothetical protein [Burkholderia cepacia complex]MDN7926974.1 hypothetical protein [Burkholderia vietnamiensis]QUN41450.1 hypothetical protein KEH56_18600 [Burkholderia cenocepacia]QUO30769.1 hypothetical protein KEH57_36700 [Burkholderia cenocepacia]